MSVFEARWLERLVVEEDPNLSVELIEALLKRDTLRSEEYRLTVDVGSVAVVEVVPKVLTVRVEADDGREEGASMGRESDESE